MSQTVITAAFEEWKAQEAAGGNRVVLDGFVLANVPGLDPDAPVSNTETLPPDDQIVYRQDVDKCGVVNNNAVVYSITMGSNIGTFDFNWIGLVNKASGVLAMIVHTPMQRKLKTQDGQQGNAVNRSFLMEYDGAATETEINTPAQTWQIDFTARLSGMDEEWRLANVDIYGQGAFFGDGFLVKKDGGKYQVQTGNGYIGGVRATLNASEEITATSLPAKVFADVSWQGALTGRWQAVTVVQASTAELADYIDGDGFAHYVFAIASIDAAGVVTDLRPIGSIPAQVADGAVKSVSAGGDTHEPDEHGNIKLGSAADADTQTSRDDITAGRVLVNGGALALRTVLAGAGRAVTDFDGLPANSVSFGYSDATHSPGFTGSVLDFSGSSGRYNVQIATQYNGNGNHIAFRTHNGDAAGAWNNWFELFHTGNPPTAAQSGAMPYFGTAMSMDLNTLGAYSAAGVHYQPTNAGATTANHYPVAEAGALLVLPSAYGCQQLYITFGMGRVFSRGLSGPWNGTNGPWGSWNEPYSPTNPNEIVSTSANSFRIAYGGYGAFWRQDGAHLYLMLTNKNDPRGNYNALRPFYVDLATGYPVMGRLNLTDWTYFDARYLTKTTSMSRLGAQVVVDVPNHKTVSAPAGCVQSAVRCGNDGSLTGMGYRPFQILVNGAWVNVQSL